MKLIRKMKNGISAGLAGILLASGPAFEAKADDEDDDIGEELIGLSLLGLGAVKNSGAAMAVGRGIIDLKSAEKSRTKINIQTPINIQPEVQPVESSRTYSSDVRKVAPARPEGEKFIDHIGEVYIGVGNFYIDFN